MNTFTDKQINDWHEYEFVRQMGSYNMFDPRARRATGLTGEEYSFCMKHYSALKETAAKAEAKQPPMTPDQSLLEREVEVNRASEIVCCAALEPANSLLNKHFISNARLINRFWSKVKKPIGNGCWNGVPPMR